MNNGKRDTYYVRNNFLILGNGVLLKNDKTTRKYNSNTFELCSYVASGYWDKAEVVAKRMNDYPMVSIIDVEKGDLDSAYVDYNPSLSLQFPNGYPAKTQGTIDEFIADRLMADGKIEKAKEFYQKAVEGYCAWLDHLQSIKDASLKFDKTNLKLVTAERVKKEEKSFDFTIDQENLEIDRVKQKIRIIEDQI